jgi:subtilase family serine protease
MEFRASPRRVARVVAIASVTSLALGAGVTSPALAAGRSPLLRALLRGHAPVSGPHVRLGCSLGRAHAGTVGCLGQAIAYRAGEGPRLMAGPTGLGPSDIQSAYALGGLNASGRTVAIVDAYSDPNAPSDLATFRSTYGLAPCTTAGGASACLRIENQNGAASPLPSNDAGWAEEISLDLDAVSSACPTCHILLVEANSANTSDLETAENTAAAASPASISNSYGGSEASTDLSGDAFFHHSGVAITVSSGDSGYGVEWPASSPAVTAVGGTTLTKAAGTARGWTETAWSGAGSGCSAYEPKQSWQTDSECTKRTVADVSADADPNSGLGIYDTDNGCGSSGLCDLLIQLGLVTGLDGWAQVGGTSLSSPIVASVYALAGNTSAISDASYVYAHASGLNDVTSGSNGSCSPPYLCTAGPGYDGPTGLGTPNGTAAF